MNRSAHAPVYSGVVWCCAESTEECHGCASHRKITHTFQTYIVQERQTYMSVYATRSVHIRTCLYLLQMISCLRSRIPCRGRIDILRAGRRMCYGSMGSSGHCATAEEEYLVQMESVTTATDLSLLQSSSQVSSSRTFNRAFSRNLERSARYTIHCTEGINWTHTTSVMQEKGRRRGNDAHSISF